MSGGLLHSMGYGNQSGGYNQQASARESHSQSIHSLSPYNANIRSGSQTQPPSVEHMSNHNSNNNSSMIPQSILRGLTSTTTTVNHSAHSPANQKSQLLQRTKSQIPGRSMRKSGIHSITPVKKRNLLNNFRTNTNTNTNHTRNNNENINTMNMSTNAGHNNAGNGNQYYLSRLQSQSNSLLQNSNPNTANQSRLQTSMQFNTTNNHSNVQNKQSNHNNNSSFAQNQSRVSFNRHQSNSNHNNVQNNRAVAVIGFPQTEISFIHRKFVRYGSVLSIEHDCNVLYVEYDSVMATERALNENGNWIQNKHLRYMIAVCYREQTTQSSNPNNNHTKGMALRSMSMNNVNNGQNSTLLNATIVGRNPNSMNNNHSNPYSSSSVSANGRYVNFDGMGRIKPIEKGLIIADQSLTTKIYGYLTSGW